MILLANDFGKADFNLIGNLLCHISDTLESNSGIKSPREVIVLHWDEEYPMTSNHQEYRPIRLATKGDYFCQWAYQFAHEYCHHLIDGQMSGRLVGLKWFEECLCHTASLFCLSKLANPILWNQWGYPRYDLAVRGHIEGMLNETESKRKAFYHQSRQSRLGIGQLLPELTITQDAPNIAYPRDAYNVVALLMLPAFLRNARLWEILQHIGNSERWQSLEELLSHLGSVCSPDVSDVVRELGHLLLPLDL